MHTPHTFTHRMILGHNRNHCQGKSRLSAASLYTRAYAVKVNCKIPDTAAQRSPRRTCCSSFLPFPQPSIHPPPLQVKSKASLPRSRSHQRLTTRHTMHRRGATTATADPHSPASPLVDGFLLLLLLWLAGLVLALFLEYDRLFYYIILRRAPFTIDRLSFIQPPIIIIPTESVSVELLLLGLLHLRYLIHMIKRYK